MAELTGGQPGVRIERCDEGHPDRQAALRLVVGGGVQPIAQVQRSLELLIAAIGEQGTTLDPVLAAWWGGRLIASTAVIESPGRTGMMLLGMPNSQRIGTEAAVALLTETESLAWSQDMVLLQALLAVEDTHGAAVHRDAGYQFLAELVYLDCMLSGALPRPHRPSGLSYLAYLPELESRFVATLNETYRESLDCAGLEGVRDTSDVLEGHRHTGVTDPEALWYLAMRGDTPLGVLLLSGVHNRSCLEVVYMGVVAEARGQGLGDALLSLAVDVARRRGASALTLAVDSTNVFASRLYARWGFGEVGRRRAWICCRSF